MNPNAGDVTDVESSWRQRNSKSGWNDWRPHAPKLPTADQSPWGCWVGDVLKMAGYKNQRASCSVVIHSVMIFRLLYIMSVGGVVVVVVCFVLVVLVVLVCLFLFLLLLLLPLLLLLLLLLVAAAAAAAAAAVETMFFLRDRYRSISSSPSSFTIHHPSVVIHHASFIIHHSS